MTEADISESEISSVKENGGEIFSSSATAPEDNATSDLTHGSSSQTANDKPINDPIWYVDRFRKHREQSVREVVNSTIAVCEGLDAIGEDKTEFQRFVKALADAKVMSQAEAKKQKRADMSTLSKIQKIYEHRDIILHQSVADKLCTGYSVLYELGLLIDQLMPEGDITEEVVIDVSNQLGLHLEALDGDLTRRWIKGVRENVGNIPTREKKAKPDKPATERAFTKTSDDDDQDGTVTDEGADRGEYDSDDESTTEAVGNANSGNAVVQSAHDLASRLQTAEAAEVVIADAGGPFTAALLVMGWEDEEALVWAAQKREWHRIADKMAKDSVVLIYAPLQLLLGIIPVIGTFGCARCANVYLLTEPEEIELTKCKILAIFERGEGISVESVPNWKPDDTPFAIAEQFLQGVPGRRVQIFADGHVEGWEALAFDDDYTPGLHR